MKTIEIIYEPGDICWIRGQYRECIIESVIIEEDNITYNWCNFDVGYDITEVWDDGYFTLDDVGVTVFDTLEELENAFPDDFNFKEY